MDENFATAERFIRDAASRKCSLVVLPEYHLTSWVLSDENFRRASKYSETFVARYQDLARGLSINIVPGTICYSASDEDNETGSAARLINVAHFIEADTGVLRSSYQKRNLWHTEQGDLMPGSEPPRAFDTKFRDSSGQVIRAGMLICWDLAFPEAFRSLLADGAHMVIIPSFWFAEDAGSEGLALNGNSEKLFLESAVALRAFENIMVVVFCNAGGFSGVGVPFLGRLGTSDEGEGLQVIDVDLDIVKKAEDNYRIRHDLSPKM